MQATLRCCRVVLIAALCSPLAYGHRDLQQLQPAPIPANRSSPVTAPATPLATNRSVVPRPPSPRLAPPPPSPPPSPRVLRSSPPPPPSPIKVLPAAAALAGAGAPVPAPQGSFWAFAPAPAPGPAPAVSPSATVPTVSALITLPSFTLQSFDTSAQAQFINSIKTAYPNNNVAVNINSINPGSVVVNTTTAFLDGDQAAADSNARDLTTAPATIFPPSTYGNVTTSGVSNGTAANPADPAADKAANSGATGLAVISLSALLGAGCILAFSL